VRCIYGSRVPVRFLVELGALISVASTTLPDLSSWPLAVSTPAHFSAICPK
jgi:hypothetical protein